uniref:Uncharacterized protein n=1 Tax=Anguilla anguilla TaxID=7936 RepID=A0A0E9TKE6_ANGAN
MPSLIFSRRNTNKDKKIIFFLHFS